MPIRTSYADCDMSQVDELAVEFACQGTRMRLNNDERVHAVRLMAGKVRPLEIAHRICTYEREITRILEALGAKICPLCRQYAFQNGGAWGRHFDFTGGHTGGAGVLCAMTGHAVDAPPDPRMSRSIESLARRRQRVAS